jgi:hypothetical protein
MCGEPTTVFSLSTKKSTLAYHRCERCGFIHLGQKHFVAQAEEKARYLLHRNDISNPGYVAFLRSFIMKAIAPFKAPDCLVLDFGSGPAPILARNLEEAGYRCDVYDPIFAKTRLWRERRYDAILLHEVAEHMRSPGTTLAFLTTLVDEGGIIAIRTRFLPESMEDFGSWWYRMDPTHVSFYTVRCLVDYFAARGFSLLSLYAPDIIVFQTVD